MPANPQSSMFEDLVESGELNGSTESLPTENQEQSQAVSTAENAISGNNNVPQETNSSTQFDFDTVLAEKTGGKFKSVDEILKLTEQKVAPEINFANETSKKVFEYLKEGKVDEFMSVYQQQKLLESVDKLDADNVLKLKIKYENPELTESEINDEFESRYGVEQPDIDEDLDDAADIEKAKKKFEREKSAMERLKKKDLKEAKDFLQEKKQEIVLPDIQTSKTQQQEAQGSEVDEVAIKEYRDKYLNSIPKTIDEIIGFESKYKDSELEFNTTYLIDANEKQALKDKMENFTLQDYFVPRYINESGDFDTESIAHDLYVLENFDKIVEAHVSQAVNQAKSMFVKGLKNANYQESVSRALPDEQQAKQDEMVNYFFGNT
jgi:hypothetical protein